MNGSKKALGQKIKYYRNRAGVSQLDLELEINTSPGRISKIENGKINPDKETVVSIAKALDLRSNEIASLFGIEVVDITHLSDSLKEIMLLKDPEEVMDIVANELIFKLGYIASAFFITEGDRVYMRGLTKTNISEKVIHLLPKPLDQLYLSLSKDKENLTVKAITESNVYLTHYTRDYTVPLVEVEVADKIQEAAGDKSNIIYPLEVKGRKMGAVVYVAKYKTDFKEERETLRLVSDQIAVALYNSLNNGN